MAETSKKPMPIAVLISGTGRTLNNIIDLLKQGSLNIEVKVVIASTPAARGLQFAEKNSIPIDVVERSAYSTRTEFSEALFQRCRESGAELVIMAGFIKMVEVPDDFVNRVINIHPALIPSFCGKGFYGHHVHEAALEYGVKLSGCTVHFVDNQLDHGPVILQMAVPVLEDDTPDTLNDRVFEAEKVAYPKAIQLLAEKRVVVEGRKVRILPGNDDPLPSPSIISAPPEATAPSEDTEADHSNPDNW